MLRVDRVDGAFVLAAGRVDDDVALANRFLAHLGTRNFAVATRRAYAYDLLNFLRFLAENGARLDVVRPTDLFDYLDWQGRSRRSTGARVVRLASGVGLRRRR
jgi:integrase/recombinase XerC